MTINEFEKLLSKVETAVIKNENPKAALIYLYKILDLVEDAAECARLDDGCPRSMKTPLADIGREANKRSDKVLGFI